MTNRTWRRWALVGGLLVTAAWNATAHLMVAELMRNFGIGMVAVGLWQLAKESE